MSRALIRLIQKLPTDQRLSIAAWLFIVSIIGMILSLPIGWMEARWFGVLLMILSWLAVTFTCWDIIQTADVRDNQKESE